jgi:hypothetical protein
MIDTILILHYCLCWWVVHLWSLQSYFGILKIHSRMNLIGIDLENRLLKRLMEFLEQSWSLSYFWGPHVRIIVLVFNFRKWNEISHTQQIRRDVFRFNLISSKFMSVKKLSCRPLTHHAQSYIMHLLCYLCLLFTCIWSLRLFKLWGAHSVPNVLVFMYGWRFYVLSTWVCSFQYRTWAKRDYSCPKDTGNNHNKCSFRFKNSTQLYILASYNPIQRVQTNSKWHNSPSLPPMRT